MQPDSGLSGLRRGDGSMGQVSVLYERPLAWRYFERCRPRLAEGTPGTSRAGQREMTSATVERHDDLKNEKVVSQTARQHEQVEQFVGSEGPGQRAGRAGG